MTEHRKIRVSVRTDLIDKSDSYGRSRTGTGWQNFEISVANFIKHIKAGHPYTHQFSGGKKSKDHFERTEILIADIDKDMTIVEALEHDLIKQFGTFIHTTPQHTPEKNRFRVIFALDRQVFDADSYEVMYRSMLRVLPTDPKAGSAAQMFFGNRDAEIHWIGKSMPENQINKMTAEGVTYKTNDVISPVIAKLQPDTIVKVKSKGLKPLNTLPNKTSIHSPFGTHSDKNPSAFVKVSQQGVHGVECRSCGQSAWAAPMSFHEDQFGIFDQMVHQYAGRENSTFQYAGLAAYDHDLDTSLAKSNFHLTKSKQFKLDGIVPGIHLIKSPKGSGKTHMLAELVSAVKLPKFRKEHGLDDHRTILIGHRQSLIRESAQKLGLECYLDTGEYDTKIIHESGVRRSAKPQHYAICLDSLFSRIRPQYERYGVVIIDESEQVFSHFLSEHMKHPTANFELLSKILKQAKFIYCLDADLDQITLTGVISCLSYGADSGRMGVPADHLQSLFFHLNEYKESQRTVEVYKSKNQLENDLRLSIQDGKRCFVTSNSKKFVTGLYESFSRAFPELRFQLVVADSGDDHQIQSFLKNIKTDILEVNALMASPSIGTGVDITFPENAERVDVVYGFFESMVNTHYDADQQLARVRHPGAVKVWISPTRHRYPIDTDKIRQELMFGDRISGLRYYLDVNGAHASEGQHPFLDLLSTVISQRNRSLNKFRDNFIQYKKSSGWSVVDVEQDVQLALEGSIVNKASKVARVSSLKQALLNAPDLSLQEVTKISDFKRENKPLTAEQKAGYQKYWMSQFYVQEVTPELIDFDDDGKSRDKIRLIEYVVDPALKHKKFRDIIDRPELLAKQKINIDQLKSVVFLRELFSVAGIYDFDTFCFRQEVVYGSSTLANFINFSQHHADRYALILGKTVNLHIHERPANQVNSLLMMVGLNHVPVKLNKGGKRGVATFKINPVTYKSIMDIVDRRRRAKKPLDGQGSS